VLLTYNVVGRAFALKVRKVGGSIPGRFMSKTQKLTLVASLINGHHLRARVVLVGPVSV